MLSDDAPSDVFVLGCGRSGTSLLAGMFPDTAYFFGDHLYPPRPSNPKGFFEDAEVNALNEALLARLLPARPAAASAMYGLDVPGDRQRWLACLPHDVQAYAYADEVETIRRLTARKPICLKDPRFCYTLDLWRPFARSPKFLCIFRDPATCVASIFQECMAMPYLHDLAVSVVQLYRVWAALYSHVLTRHATSGDWLFVQYEDLLRGTETDRLQRFVGARLNADFVDPGLNRSKAIPWVLPEARAVFEELRRRAGARLES